MSHQLSNEIERILRLPEVKQITGLGRSTIYARVSTGDFPKPFNISVRSVGWSSSSIQQWVASRIAASRSGGVI